MALPGAEPVAAPAEAVASPDDGLALPDALKAADTLEAAVGDRVEELHPEVVTLTLTVVVTVARDALGQPLSDDCADPEGVEGTDGDRPLEDDAPLVDEE